MKQGKDLRGQRFGRLTAERPLCSEPGKGVIWLCRCVCGGEKEVPAARLLQGKTQSCGCIRSEMRARQDITGRRFGRLVAVEFSHYNEKRKDCWRFRCDCGAEKVMPAATVTWCGVRSCGCLVAEHTGSINRQNIDGRRYGRLTAIRPTDRYDNSGSILWECRCDCGAVVYYSVNRLSRGRTLSCGCLYRDSRGTTSENRKDAVEGTILSTLVTAKGLRSDNSSGCTGVYYDKRTDKWNAYITFQKKWHFLGGFKEKSQAVQARKHGEHHFHDPVISEFWNNLTEQTKQKYLENQGAER